MRNWGLTNGMVNILTAVAQDRYGRWATNTVAVPVNASNHAYAYDLNGNLLTDGTRQFVRDDENQLISVYVTNVWREDYVYDGKLRRRITRQYTWNGAWQLTKEVHDVYAGNVVVQERDQNNLPQVSYTRGNDLSGTLEGAGGIGGLLARFGRGYAPPCARQRAANTAGARYPSDECSRAACDAITSVLMISCEDSGPMMKQCVALVAAFGAYCNAICDQ